MDKSINPPKVFISYSWKPVTNKQKTILLAERLSIDGVHVILDQWNLAEGQDKYHFMEKMVNDEEIYRVLIICNKDYVGKANNKKDGVGIESLIISDGIYKQVEQKKFIPIIFEKDESGNPYIPIFIKTRIYIDLSSEDIFEDQYESLLRNIFDKPSSRRPPLGTPPPYLFEDDPILLRTQNKVRSLKNALINEKRNSQVFVDDYYDTFILSLDDFLINDQEIVDVNKIDELVLEKIDKFKGLKDDYIEFLDVLFTYSFDFNLDKFISFFERLIEYLFSKGIGQYSNKHLGSMKFDQHKFFFYEIFLYTISIMWEKERFNEISSLLYNKFIVIQESRGNVEPYDFTVFNNNTFSLDKFRNERLQLRRLSISADLIKQRSVHPKYTFDNLRETDILLYYISILQNETDSQWAWRNWWPRTAAYHTYRIKKIEKLASIRYFDKTKPVFGVNSVEELKSKIDKVAKLNTDRIPRYEYEFPQLNSIFDFEKIGKIK